MNGNFEILIQFYLNGQAHVSEGLEHLTEEQISTLERVEKYVYSLLRMTCHKDGHHIVVTACGSMFMNLTHDEFDMIMESMGNPEWLVNGIEK